MYLILNMCKRLYWTGYLLNETKWFGGTWTHQAAHPADFKFVRFLFFVQSLLFLSLCAVLSGEQGDQNPPCVQRLGLPQSLEMDFTPLDAAVPSSLLSFSASQQCVIMSSVRLLAFFPPLGVEDGVIGESTSSVVMAGQSMKTTWWLNYRMKSRVQITFLLYFI